MSYMVIWHYIKKINAIVTIDVGYGMNVPRCNALRILWSTKALRIVDNNQLYQYSQLSFFWKGKNDAKLHL